MSYTSENSAKAKASDKYEMIGTMACEHDEIYPITTNLEPRTSHVFLVVLDHKKKTPVPDALITWTTSLGKIGPGASVKTDESGCASALFSSFEQGDCAVLAQVAKSGYKPLEVQGTVKVVTSLALVEIVNKPLIGDIFINGQRIGTGQAKALFSKPTRCAVEWGKLEGYVPPEPAKIYVNPKFSIAPITLEGIYRKVNEKVENVKLTVFAVITADDQSGIPNPLPKARVTLEDGREGYADESGKVEFIVKANSGPVRVEVFHPEVQGLSEFRDVSFKDRDFTLNVDFGPWFGGEESVDFTAYGADLVAEAQEKEKGDGED